MKRGFKLTVHVAIRRDYKSISCLKEHISSDVCCKMSHHECGTCRALLTETSCSHCESMNLASLHLQIVFFKDSDPALVLPCFLPLRSLRGENVGVMGQSRQVRVSSHWLRSCVFHFPHSERIPLCTFSTRTSIPCHPRSIL